jgi:hypothetical protein
MAHVNVTFPDGTTELVDERMLWSARLDGGLTEEDLQGSDDPETKVVHVVTDLVDPDDVAHVETVEP